MALTEIYVDPSVNANSGAGTVGDPYGDLRYAIEQETFDTTNGVRINVKAGTAEILTENLATSLADTGTSVAWVPTETAPLVIQGYTTAAGDGGIGEIDGNATYPIFDNTAQDFIVLRDLKIGNVGSNYIVQLGDTNVFYNVEFHTSVAYGLKLDFENLIVRCYFRGIGSGAAIIVNGNCVTYGNFIDASALAGIDMVGDDGWVMHNIVKCTGATDGIYVSGQGYVWNNSIWSDGGTGTGITTNGVSKTGIVVFNNIIAGFSGTGGAGTDFTVGSTSAVRLRAHNSYYDNATHHVGSTSEYVAFNNETLSASPFTDPANNDFSPVDTGSIKEGSFPRFKV